MIQWLPGAILPLHPRNLIRVIDKSHWFLGNSKGDHKLIRVKWFMVSFHVILFTTIKSEELRGTIKVWTVYFILPSKKRGLKEKFFPQSVAPYLGRRRKKSKKVSLLLSLKNVPIHLKWLLCHLVLKVNGYTCRGSNSFHFHICVPSH